MRALDINNKMKSKIPRKKFSTKRSKYCGCPGIPIKDYDNINKILRVDKLRLSKGKGSWKVMPKDSCEVYKERFRRQKDRNQQSHDTENVPQSPNKNEKKNNKRLARKTRRRRGYKTDQKKRRHRKRSSSCSCCVSQR